MRASSRPLDKWIQRAQFRRWVHTLEPGRPRHFMLARWHFNQFRRGDQENNPISAALFSQDEVQDLAGSVVREAIQNSLDARPKGSRQPAEVRFAIRRSTTPDFGQMSRFFDGIWPHLDAERTGLDTPPTKRGSVPLLIIEDRGTTGLVGDPAQWEPDEDERNGFYLFFRATGTSGKKGESRGRWGVGKFVFPMASKGNIWFGVTATAERPQATLMGRCVLKTHRAGGVTYHPDGRWGVLDEDFVLPVESPNPLAAAFERACGITRTDAPGLTVVVPWVREEITADAIRAAVVREYFLPLLRNELIVVVENDRDVVTLNASSVRTIAAAMNQPELTATISLAADAVSIPPPSLPTLVAADHHGNAPRWDPGLIQPAVREQLAVSFDSGAMIAVRMPFHVRARGREMAPSYVDVFMRAADLGGRAHPLIVREGITVPKARTVGVSDCVALVLVDHSPLIELVGDSENPAHTELLHKLIKDKFVYAKATLDFLREAPAGLVRALREGDTEDDPFLLADFFPTVEDGTGRAERAKPKGGSVTPPPPEPPPSRPRRYRIDRSGDGFRIVGQPAPVELPAVLNVACAYEVRRGRPLNQYDPLDFSLDAEPITIEAEGATILRAAANRLRIAPNSPDFRVTVGGFDANRDLYVRVDAD